MPTPPVLSQEQRRAAYEKALELRRQRAALKQYLSIREHRLSVGWELEAARGMKVYDLLTALNGIGPKTARALLEKAGIPERNTVRACGPRQTEKLFDLLRQLGRS